MLLHQLRERRMTVSELASVSGLQKSTVHTHLKTLVDVGFVEREENGRIWVYYNLTPKGQLLVDAERPRFVLVGTIAASCLIAGVAFLLVHAALSGGWFGPETEGDPPLDVRGGEPPLAEPFLWLTQAAIALLVVGVAAGTFSFWRFRLLTRSLRAA